MSNHEKNLGTSFPTTEFEDQALAITLSNEYKGFVSAQRSFSDFSQEATLSTEVEISLHGYSATVNDKMEIRKAFSSDPSIVMKVSETPQNTELNSSISTRKKGIIWNNLALLTSNVVPPTLKLSSNPDLRRANSLKFHLSTQSLQINSQLLSLYIVSKLYLFQLNPNRYKDQYSSYASKQLASWVLD